MTELISKLHLLDKLNDSSRSEHICELAQVFQERRWHEFSTGLLELFEKWPDTRASWVDIHDTIPQELLSSISPEVYSKLLFLCSAYSEDRERVSTILQTAHDIFQVEYPQVAYGIRCTLVRLELLQTQDPDLKIRRELADIEDLVQSVPAFEISPLLTALFARVSLIKHNLLEEYTAYYLRAFEAVTASRTAGLFMSSEEFSDIAYMTVQAALLSDRIYNFGRLLTFAPFVQQAEPSSHSSRSSRRRSSRMTPIQWALNLARLCNDGNVQELEDLATAVGASPIENSRGAGGSSSKRHSKKNSSEKDPRILQALQSGLLQHKVRLMALLHFAFNTPAEQRVRIQLSVIAERCHVSEELVEPLLLSACAIGLLFAKIDELDSVVDMEWVQPRVLDKHEVKLLAEHLRGWEEVVKGTLENMAIEDENERKKREQLAIE